MKYIRFSFYVLLFSFLLVGCGAYFNQPVNRQQARAGELTSKSRYLKELPKPAEPIIAGVYNFRDQTGQYKNIDVGSSFSTAISQGGTTMLIKALEDSGWFTVLERENLGNLLNERNIINTTREQYKKAGSDNQPQLPPLLFAGILLEGGVVSYDTNIITGGAGARYFGVGSSTQYREDRITVYLRAVSTTNGRILKTVYVSKTILSQAVSANLFKYVNFQRLLEVETGFTVNEPVQLAMKDAIEKAVESLIIEGISENLWRTASGKETDSLLVANYFTEKDIEESTLLYDRKQVERSQKNSVAVTGGTNILDGDLGKKKMGYSFRASYTRDLTRNFSAEFNFNLFELRGGNFYNNSLTSVDANIQYRILPNDDLAPYVYGGVGFIYDMVTSEEFATDSYFKIQYGLGLQYYLNQRWSLLAFAEQNYAFSDELDNIISGKRNDIYYNFGLGLKYFF